MLKTPSYTAILLKKSTWKSLPVLNHTWRGAKKVRKLKKASYGLKQSLRAWLGRFSKVIIAIGYKQNQGDHMLFIQHPASSIVQSRGINHWLKRSQGTSVLVYWISICRHAKYVHLRASKFSRELLKLLKK